MARLWALMSLVEVWTLRIEGTPVSYKTGDSLAVWPRNPFDKVEARGGREAWGGLLGVGLLCLRWALFQSSA